ncbi:MAG: tRNA glutamyl-Q(34) synthetase GluQRS [Pseudomarimonas sp.]
MPAYRGRFAPSPTGPLHFGSLVAALGSWLDARYHQGTWMVRIEDLDPPRERAGAAGAQLRTLAALGLHADEPILRQSTRSDAYEAALATLAQSGHVFECRCSRNDLAAADGLHLACVSKPSGKHAALRFRPQASVVSFEDRLHGAQTQAVPDTVGDVVLRRADGLYAYQLAVVVDDAAQGITDVVRGADLLASTTRQIALQLALVLPTPRYLHLPLVLDDQGRKLSKSLAACPVDDEQPLAVLQQAWRFLFPTLPNPAGNNCGDWLRRAAEAYRPEALGRHNRPAADQQQR